MSDIQRQRVLVKQFVQSAPRRTPVQLLHEPQCYTLGAESDRLFLVSTDEQIDYRTAASHALIMACWLGDLELVGLLIRDLREIIDINTLVSDSSAIEWTMNPFHNTEGAKITHIRARRHRMGIAADICRYLIIQYGPKMDVNRPRAQVLCWDYDYLDIDAARSDARVLGMCLDYGYSDIVAYLVETYRENLVHRYVGSCNIFEVLVEGGYETEAELYLRLFYNKLSWFNNRPFRAGPCAEVIDPAVRYASIELFKTVLDVFGYMCSSHDLDSTFWILCRGSDNIPYNNEKIQAAFGLWSGQLEAKVINRCLINEWQSGFESRYGQGDMGLEHSRAAQLIVMACYQKLDSEGIAIALAACCFPSNPELFDTVFDHHQGLINRHPKLLQHMLLECCSLGDIDMFEHILALRANLVSPLAIEIWARAGDLEAVSMLLDHKSDLMLRDSTQKALTSACIHGDADMVELLIRSANDLDEPCYNRAFRAACYNNHENTVKVLIMHGDCNLRPDTNYDLNLDLVEGSIIELLNSTFGTTIVPVRDSSPCSMTQPADFWVRYEGRPRIYYALDRV